jgi:hypothetical protein
MAIFMLIFLKIPEPYKTYKAFKVLFDHLVFLMCLVWLKTNELIETFIE